MCWGAYIYLLKRNDTCTYNRLVSKPCLLIINMDLSCGSIKVWILISLLLMKQADLDLHFFQRGFIMLKKNASFLFLRHYILRSQCMTEPTK